MVRLQFLPGMAGNNAADIPPGDRTGIRSHADTDDLAVCIRAGGVRPHVPEAFGRIYKLHKNGMLPAPASPAAEIAE